MNKKILIELLLKYGIIKTNFKQPITFKSGIKSPIYCNLRECSSYPDLMKIICENFQELFKGVQLDGIVGIATGAIQHSTLLAYSMNLPSGYIRPDAKAKEYGLRNLIEGINPSGKRIGLIEDLVSTGGSVLTGAEVLKKAGAGKIYIVSIFSYDMEKMKEEFAKNGLILQSIITIHDLMPYLKISLSFGDYKSIENWVSDPEGWS